MNEIKQCLNKKESQAAANQEKHFLSLSQKKQDRLMQWCLANFKMIKTINTELTSYDIKTRFCQEKDGFYVTNGQIKGAMIRAGFEAKTAKDGVNSRFNVSKTSPFFNH